SLALALGAHVAAPQGNRGAGDRGAQGEPGLVSPLPGVPARPPASHPDRLGPSRRLPARAYLRDLPNAELHLFEDGGHWLLETHLDEVARLSRDFLVRSQR